ncbi:hypothetical protein [Dendronalium sp. ChiSLP03b]|uniref:hypothetical protein n=1 Tax=Dendronalium sp. ChiSLP03b TaxID=3075381 RepID=UPI002AD23C33|nr:hypothetical protein [Dendronalium sp. ChiSLP03b]MDZ8202885.1 hypothetical protein [Dendronalium sp. ChiSLP03b]
MIFLDKGIVTEQGPAYEMLTNHQSDRLRIFLNRLNPRELRVMNLIFLLKLLNF